MAKVGIPCLALKVEIPCLALKVEIPCLALKVEIPCLALKVEIPCLALKFCYHFLDRAGQGRYSCYNRRTVHTEHFKFEMILSHPGYVQ